MKEKLLILGAGAIGRGYLPWVFPSYLYNLVFVDSDPCVVQRLGRGSYVTYRVHQGAYESINVEVQASMLPRDFNVAEHSDAVVCFICVGPRNVESAAKLLMGSSIPCVLCENDPNSVATVKSTIGHDKVFFAIPDVITSNTAPSEYLKRDPLSVVTESGTLFIDSALGLSLGQEVQMISTEALLGQQWTAKLYLHNTPHCIAAYLGAFLGKTYIHEAMAVRQIDEIVSGAMEEMLEALKRDGCISMDFLRWYASKELSRFRCELYDPVARVAREPLRKLEAEGRLIGAAQRCIASGVMPNNLLVGITAALLFEDNNDPDHYLVLLRKALSNELFNTYILGLRSGEPLNLMLCKKIDRIIEDLRLLLERNK